MFSTVSRGHTVAGVRTMRRLFTFLIVAACAGVATPAAAVTVDQIVSLSKAGVSEAVILALIDRDRTILTIDPEQIVTLKREGLSDTLITAMLQSGRDEAEDAARAVSSWNAATMLSSIASTPNLVVVGHGPDRPNTIHTEDWYSGFRDGVRVPSAGRYGSGIGYGTGFGIGYGSRYASGFGPSARSNFRGGLNSRAFEVPATTALVDSDKTRAREPMLCLAQMNTAAGPGASYVTECPAVMQKARQGR